MSEGPESKSIRALIAVYGRPAILALFPLGFASGLPLALTASTLMVWMAESGVDLATIGLFASVGTPYALKFLWAPVMDRVVLPWLGTTLGRRRGWILLTQVLLMVALVALGASAPDRSAGITAILAFTVAFLSASQDIVIDAFRVESLEEREQAAGAAAVVFGYRVGMLASGAGALYLASYASWAVAYTVMAGLMLVGVVTVLLRPEPAPESAVNADRPISPGGANNLDAALAWLREAVVAPFADFTRRRGWLAILLFVMLYKFGDSLAGVMTSPFLVDVGFSKIEIANVSKVYGFGATMAGLALGGGLMNAAGMWRSLWVCGVLQLLSNFMFAVQAMVGANLGLLALTIGIENLAGGMGTAVFVAYLSSLCNVSYTATQYALLSSFMAAARTWLSSSAGFAAEAMDWVGFFIMTAFAALPGLVLLWWLGRREERRP